MSTHINRHIQAVDAAARAAAANFLGKGAYMRSFEIMKLVLAEWFLPENLQRVAEPALDVPAFHQAGSDALLGVYHFNALATHGLTPEGGTVVDLGCGSGQALIYLAQRRPDLRIIGIELDPKMIALGQGLTRDHQLSDRVEFRRGDMTQFSNLVAEKIHLVRSLFSLHHLDTERQFHQCILEIEKVCGQSGAGFWIFDHARPRRKQTADRFPAIFTPHALAGCCRASTDSLIAAWTFQEMTSEIQTVFEQRKYTRHCAARFLELYQTHWAANSDANLKPGVWIDLPLEKSASADFQGLKFLFKGVKFCNG